MPFVNFWPDGNRFACVLTHDVEGPAGIANIERVRKVERRHGFVSSWNFVAEDYPIADGLFEKLRADGCEIGLHGIHHDRKLFESRESFEADLPKIHRYLADWQAVGWRSPVTYRNADWMPRLGALYDSSFPDTDPFEPQAGGCCSIFPFFLDEHGRAADHARPGPHDVGDPAAPGIDLWLEKSDWISENHGLVNLTPTPTTSTRRRGSMYEEFLGTSPRRPAAWHALPREVAQWVAHARGADLRARRAPAPASTGVGAERASVAWARAGDGETVTFDIEQPHDRAKAA